MNQEQEINQALRLTVQDLTTQLAEATVTKNLLAVQLTIAEQEKEQLQDQINQLMAELEQATAPDTEK